MAGKWLDKEEIKRIKWDENALKQNNNSQRKKDKTTKKLVGFKHHKWEDGSVTTTPIVESDDPPTLEKKTPQTPNEHRQFNEDEIERYNKYLESKKNK